MSRDWRDPLWLEEHLQGKCLPNCMFCEQPKSQCPSGCDQYCNARCHETHYQRDMDTGLPRRHHDPDSHA